MESKTGKLEVETGVIDKYAVVRVKDNGTGISAENLPHLFQPYFTGKKNGIGLGLATTHASIQSHNGTIDVESEVGNGTTFIVKLLLAQ